MQITNILIWQIDSTLRNLELEENKVNVITGDSGKGKSSVLAIVDYCLLSSSSDGISKTNVDNFVNWYGIRLSINGKYFTICRKATHFEEDDLVYFDKNGGIPQTPINNIKKDVLKEHLNYELGINSFLKIPYGGRFIQQGSKVSYRYFIPHCFIDQTTLTSSEHLYSKISDLKTRERIDRTFDMALGSENAETMIMRTRLEELQRNLARIEYKQSASKDSFFNFESEIESLYDRACHFGLIIDNSKNEQTVGDKFENLRAIVNYKDINEIPAINEKTKIEKELFLLKKELTDIDEYIETNTEYKKFLKDNQDSLLIAKYLDDSYSNILYTKNIYSIIKSLLNQSSEIKKAIAEKGQNSLISKTNDKRKELELKISSLIKKLATVSDEKITPIEIYRFMGELSSEIKRVVVLPKYDYADTIEKIVTKIDELESKITDNNSFKEYTLSLLNGKIKEIFTRMPLKGFEDATPIFNKAKKTLDLINKNQVEKMIDIGSASNYMYVHVAYFLALHELVRDRNVPWVPRFLVIDQPSTPYFSTAGKKTDDFASLDAALNEINSFVEKMRSHGGFQIILLEHIEESYWLDREMTNFTLVDNELRGNYGLIHFN
jgi:energy-coupling factor transporter ATP-binding protein EcfA2